MTIFLRVLTWVLVVLAGHALLLLHEPYAKWSLGPCPPTGFYEDGTECVPGLAALFLVPISLICLGFVILLRVLRFRGQSNDARTGMEKPS